MKDALLVVDQLDHQKKPRGNENAKRGCKTTDGRTYKSGESFTCPDGCNTCICSCSARACGITSTKMGCNVFLNVMEKDTAVAKARKPTNQAHMLAARGG